MEKLEIILMLSAVILGAIVLVSSRFVRAVCRESIRRPRHKCELEVDAAGVTVRQSSEME